MKKGIVKVGVAAAFAASLFGATATYEIDSSHSSAQFKVKHLMIANVRGEFQKVSGTVVFDPANLAGSKIEATIPIATISTREENRDKHLKSPDFFDEAKYPTANFKSKKLAAAGSGKYTVTGDLTLHGVTKEVVLNVEGPTAEVKGARGESRVGAQATTRINRKDFGMTWNKAIDGGGVVVSDEVDITIDMELIKK